MFIEVLIILIAGLAVGKLFELLKMPKLLGYLLLGMTFQLFGIIDGEILLFKKEITVFSLSVILLKAGLGIDEKTIKSVGVRAGLLGVIPNLLEGFTIALLAYFIFDVSFVEAGMLGFIVSPISPAVVIPSMIKIKERGYNKTGVPVLNLASASIDDIVSVIMFSIFLFLYSGSFTRDNLETIIWPMIYIGIMSIGYLLHFKTGKRFLRSITNIWGIAQIYLFFVIGLLVNVKVMTNIGLIAVVIVIIGLLLRYVGVLLCLKGSIFNRNERLFCLIANTPKATVQASLGAIPLIYGVGFGETILAISTLSILLTAPIGLILIERFAPILLKTKKDV